MDPLNIVNLRPLMERTSGAPGVVIGLLDGPVARSDVFAGADIRVHPASTPACDPLQACRHGTFVAGVLVARRDSTAPAICPGCALLVRPVFRGPSASATPDELAAAILDAVSAKVRVINLSLSLPVTADHRAIAQALDHAAARGVLVVAAAGNEATIRGSALLSHPWVLPVVGCDGAGRPIAASNLGHAIGRRGLAAPGAVIRSVDPAGAPVTATGTSAAAPFVTGTVALLWSEFPTATAVEIKSALARAAGADRRSVVPPLLDAWGARQILAGSRARA